MALRPAVAQDLGAVVALVEAAYAPWIAVIGRRRWPIDRDDAA
jgi:hypothetical protein